MANIDQQFIEYIVKSLVDKPDEVKVDRRVDERGVLLELTVDPEDLGRVIGKRGSTAQSLRSLLRAFGTKNEARYNLKIVDVDRENAQAATEASTDDAAESATTEPAAESTAEETDAKPSADESDNDVETPTDETVENSDSDRLKNTRKELAEFDDLDV